jgi:putative ABC transport system permease protein
VSLFTDLRERFRAIVSRGRMERELEDELRFHLENETEARRRAGSQNPEREARLAFGNVESVKQQVRDARGIRALEDFVADTRFALRALRRNRGFTLAVVAVLGLATGAATAVYVIVDRVLLAEFPFREPHRLVRVDMQSGAGYASGTLSVVDIQAIAANARTFEAFGAVRWSAISLSGVATPERITLGRAQAGFFRALDVRAARGRLIEPADELRGAPAVLVLTDAQAQRLFGSAERALGRNVTLDGVIHTVVGVLEPDRAGLAGPRTEAWSALQLETPERRGPFGYRAVARLSPQASLEQAEQEMAALSARVFPTWAASFNDSKARYRPVPLREALVGHARAPLGLFAGAVALVLLAAIANVATLLLVRALAREHELAVREALGAGLGRLSRLIITECLVLAGLAGLVATAIATLGVRFAPALAPNLPRIAQAQMSWSAVGVALGLALVCGLLVSVAPLSVAARRGSSAAARLAGSGTRAGTGRRATAARSALIVAEFAIAFPLLVGAGLLANSFLRLSNLDLGFDPNGVYGLEVAIAGPRYDTDEERLAFWRRLEARAVETTGITAAGFASSIPPDNFGDVNNFNLLDKLVPPGGAEPVTPWVIVTSGYFDVLGVKRLEGRSFNEFDAGEEAPVAIASRAWATKYYSRDSAVGKQLYSGGCTTCNPTTVAGVVDDVQFRGLAAEADAVYVPLAQAPASELHLLVRSRLGPAATFRELRSALAAVDPEIAPVEVDLATRVSEALGDPRRWSIIVGGFACASVLLAALGVFGLMSYIVRQRERELAIRLAVGASPGSLTQLVVRRGVRYAGIGIGLGGILAVVQTRWLESLLFGVEPIDFGTLAIAAAAMLVVASAACWIPGLRAARISPREALAAS